MTRMRFLALVGTVLMAQAASAESWFDKLLDNGLTVRKSFDGTAKDAAAPAEVSYQNPDTGSTTYKVDLAMKLTEYGWLSDQLRLYPVLEHHRNSLETDKTYTTSAGAILQFDRALGTCTDSNGNSIEGCHTFLSDLNWKFTRDSENDVTTRFLSLKFGWNSGEEGFPGYKFGDDQFRFYYYPSLGVEIYESQPIKQKVGDQTILLAPEVDETFLFARMFFELRPFSGTLNERLSLSGSYTNRMPSGNSEFLVDNNELTEFSVDWYLDEKKRVGIGLSYQVGRDPKRNFLNEESSSIGLKFRLPSE